MRQSVIIATTAVFTAILIIWGTAVNLAYAPKHPNAALASTSTNVMQMMKNANDLPVQKFDAF